MPAGEKHQLYLEPDNSPGEEELKELGGGMTQGQVDREMGYIQAAAALVEVEFVLSMFQRW